MGRECQLKNIQEVITYIFYLGGMRLCCWKAPKTDDDESMYSAREGERNSLTSFVSIDDEESRLADCVMTGKSNIELFRKMIESKTGFTKNGTIGRTDLWFLPRSSTGVPMIVMGEITIPATISIDRIRSYIMDLETKSQWDPEFLMGKQIETTLLTDQTSRISKCWSACRSKPGISGRDFVYNAYSELADDKWTVVCWSADLDEIPFGYLAKQASSVHVRAILILGGFYVRRENDMHRITYVNQVELGLSSWLSDPVLKKGPALLNALAQQLDS